MTDAAPPSLRERKKLEVRKALSDAAVELMFERGLENVVRESIAERAGVSPRTFGNYFADKYDALAYRVTFRLRRSAELLRTRPTDEPLWTAIGEAVVEPLRADGAPFGRPTRRQLSEVRKLNQAPEMQTALTRAAAADLVEAIAERTGTDPGTDLYPRLVAGVAVSVLTAVLNAYPHIDPAVTMPDVLRSAFAAVADGLPLPTLSDTSSALIGLLDDSHVG